MRARGLKPAFFKNELLATSDPLYGWIFAGLWCLADRAGRLEDRPRRIHLEVNPGRAFEGTEEALAWLDEHGFIVRYDADGRALIQVVNFEIHQQPHHREPDSRFPGPDKAQGNTPVPSDENPGHARGEPGASPGLEGHESSEHGGKACLTPDSGLLTPDSGPLREEPRAPEDGAARASPAPIKIPDDWQPNETNRQWLVDAGLTEPQQREVVGEFVRWARHSGHRKKNWQLAFSRNPAVKSAIGRAKANGEQREAEGHAKRDREVLELAAMFGMEQGADDWPTFRERVLKANERRLADLR